MKVEKIKLSEKEQQELNKIYKKVDEEFKELWDELDKILKPLNMTHNDVLFDDDGLYIKHVKTGEKVYITNK